MMKRVMMAGLALLCVGASPAGEQPQLPGWMAGCWAQDQGDRRTEEDWMAPLGNSMTGASRTIRAGKIVESESMKIVLDGGAMSYRASPDGAPVTAFAWAASGDPGVTFVNAAHDYPQRIHYWKEGELLMAEISLADGSKPMRWAYTRVECPMPTPMAK